MFLMSSFSEKGLLGELEHLVLLSVLHLGEAHAPAVRDDIHGRAGVDLARGSVYVALDRLDRKGYLDSWFGDPTPERGGKSKRLFRATAAGRRALAQSDRALARMRAGLGALRRSRP
jgi:PadR family transcriptional regulator, regulatory protein PadR